MILIADSGSSKTDWRLIHSNGTVSQAKTKGFNPFYMDEISITEALQNTLPQQVSGTPSQVHFYGAGCSDDINKQVIKNAINSLWPEANVYVEHDLLAAARALCNHEQGIACILGTGSNSCFYNGTEITSNVPSLGYVLGDEGSGAYIGNKLLKKYLRNQVPVELSKRIDARFQISTQNVLHEIYKKPMPSKYMATFSKFIFQNIKHPFLYKLVYDAFTDFFEQNIMLYSNYNANRIHFTGSVAFYFSNILRQVASDKNVTVQNIVETPIAGLTLYHQQKAQP